MNQEQIDKLTLWEETQQKLTRLKAQELKLRKEIFADMFPNPKLGVNNIPLNADWILQGTAKESKSVDQAVLVTVINNLSATAADKAVKLTYGINYKAFEFIDDNDKALLMSAVTTKPATPTLKITKPKR